MTDVTDEASETSSGRRLTQKEYARLKGWSKQYIHQLIRQGRVPTEDGRIDPSAADAALARTRDPARDRRLRVATGPDEPSMPADDPQAPAASSAFVKARTVRENYTALMAKAEYELMQGKLVSAAEVENAAFDIARQLRGALLSAARKIGDYAAAELRIDGPAVAGIAERHISSVLSELVRNLDQGPWRRTRSESG